MSSGQVFRGFFKPLLLFPSCVGFYWGQGLCCRKRMRKKSNYAPKITSASRWLGFPTCNNSNQYFSLLSSMSRPQQRLNNYTDYEKKSHTVWKSGDLGNVQQYRIHTNTSYTNIAPPITSIHVFVNPFKLICIFLLPRKKTKQIPRTFEHC